MEASNSCCLPSTKRPSLGTRDIPTPKIHLYIYESCRFPSLFSFPFEYSSPSLCNLDGGKHSRKWQCLQVEREDYIGLLLLFSIPTPYQNLGENKNYGNGGELFSSIHLASPLLKNVPNKVNLKFILHPPIPKHTIKVASHCNMSSFMIPEQHRTAA